MRLSSRHRSSSGSSLRDLGQLGFRAGALLAFLSVVFLSGAFLSGAEAAPAKYYFQVRDVKAPKGADPALKAYLAEAVKAELAARPSWASDLGGVEGEAAVVAELKKRNLRGFDVTVRLEEVKKDVKEPKPGGTLKRLTAGVRLTVFGTAIPGSKLAFSGDGEASLETEVTDRQMTTEGADMTKEAAKDALKQAVDQAEAKLALGQSVPLNESKRKKPK